MRPPTQLIPLIFLVTFLSACGAGAANSPPVIDKIIASPSVVLVGEQTIFTVIVTDPEGDYLTYEWAADYGTFQTDQMADTVVYVAPEESLTDLISVTVWDGFNTAVLTYQLLVVTDVAAMPPTDTPPPAPTLTSPPEIIDIPRGYFQNLCEQEPNNQRDAANGPLYFETSYCGYIDDFYDFFSVEIPADGELTIQVFDYAGTDSEMRIFYMATTILVEKFKVEGHLTETVTVQPGIYYIYFVNGNTLNYPDPYSLQIDFVPAR